ncbi:MAG: hypothetical protein SGPRY_015088, partial [Prymnesium sp.]
AMLGFLHVIHIHAGVRFEGYLSPSNDLKFSDMPVGCLASLEAVPTLGWLQIMMFTLVAETGYAANPQGLSAQPKSSTITITKWERELAGDIGGSGWVRYEEEGTKVFKLNVERQNGRAAMMGITGCIIHELLGVDALYPIGGYDGAAPEAFISTTQSFSKFPAFESLL